MSEHTITKKEFEQVLADASRHKEDAKEASGRHGKAVSQAVEAYNLNTAAFNKVVVLAKKEPTKQQEFIRDFLLYADYAGMFESVDAFDDLGQMMIDIGQGIKGRASPAPADKEAAGTVASLAH